MTGALSLAACGGDDNNTASSNAWTLATISERVAVSMQDDLVEDAKEGDDVVKVNDVTCLLKSGKIGKTAVLTCLGELETVDSGNTHDQAVETTVDEQGTFITESS